jgi:hypothetical protein
MALQVLSDFAAERASVVSAVTAQVSAAGSEVEALRRLLRLKGREVQQLRHLGQEVLLQRSEVEIFLLSSLHQVRCACAHTHTGAAAAGLLQTSKSLPPWLLLPSVITIGARTVSEHVFALWASMEALMVTQLPQQCCQHL